MCHSEKYGTAGGPDGRTHPVWKTQRFCQGNDDFNWGNCVCVMGGWERRVWLPAGTKTLWQKKKWHFWKIERRSLWLNCGTGKVDLDKMEDVDRSREYRTLLTILCLLISILSVMERSWRVLRRSITDCYFQFQKITLKAFWKMDWKGQKWMWRDLIKSVLQ